MEQFDVVIIGAGPVGLSAAIAAKRKGLSYVILEKGIIANSIFHFPTNMVFFTTADLLEIGGHPFPSTARKPTRQMALDYYRLIVKNENLNVRLFHRVDRIDGEEGDFHIFGTRTSFHQSQQFEMGCKAVVVATGYFDNPLGLGGIPGEDGPNVSYYFTDPHPFFGLDVVIVGAGNSGAEAALELYRHGANVTLVHRHPKPRDTIKYWVAPDLLNRIAEGSIKAVMPAEVTEIQLDGVVVNTPEGVKKIVADHVFVLTGFRPNIKMLKALGIQMDSNGVASLTTAYESSRHGLFLVGSVGFGKYTNAVFIENGREHAFIAIDEIAKRLVNPNYTPIRFPLEMKLKQVNT